jgi:PAS domain S-box-containing protein
MSSLAKHSSLSYYRLALQSAIVVLTCLGLFLTPWTAPNTHPIESVVLAVAGLMLATLPIQLPAERRPISQMTLVLVPSWLLAGPLVTLALAWLTHLAAALARRPVRLPLPRQVLAATMGLGLAGLADWLLRLAGVDGWQLDALRTLAVGVGLWLGQSLVESVGRGQLEAGPTWLLGLLTNLVLLPPGFFLAQIGADGDPLAFSVSVVIAVGLLMLVRVSMTSDARAVELSSEAASSAEELQRLETIVDQAPEAIFTIDAAGNVRWINRTAAEWLGDQAAVSVGRPAREVLALRGGAELDHLELLERARADGRPIHQEGSLATSSVAPAHLLISYSATGQADGDLGLILLRDATLVTESLREQEELAVHLSHELRAPLTTILGYAQLMANPASVNAIPNAQAEFARRISESGDYMLRLVNNLLDLNRLSRNESDELPALQVDLTTLTREVVESHRPQANARSQELVCDLPERPVYLNTSDLAVRQILTNLLANAIKYTPPNGHVRVALIDDPTSVTWQVVDDGIGIPPEEQERLFTRFFRSQRPEARQTRGTGLGLALTRALTEHLNGQITVESSLNRGSTFTVRLPRLAD